MNTTITLKLTASQEEKLYQTFASSAAETPPYARWQLRPENCTITCYESGKTVFQGKDAEVYASAFQKKQKVILPQAGSDEVGTGDYFGPVCVCACIVTEKDMDLISSLQVQDSKSLTDPVIREIAPKLMKQLTYSLLIVPNEKYNKVHDTSNMNAIKAKLHNQAYVNLSKKTALPKFMVIDQFAPESLYYRYLRSEKQIVRDIHFETKAEDKYIAVGAASIIARYAFLVSMDEMEKKYDMVFQKGAGTMVDQCAARFVEKYGFERLSEVAKLHFKNTEKITLR